MRHYELVVVLSPVLSQEDTSGAWQRIKQLITQHGGDSLQEEQWGPRRLAYPIRKGGQTFHEGNYLLARFSTEKVLPGELETNLRLSENVLRFLLVKSQAPKPSPLPEASLSAQEEAPVEGATTVEAEKLVVAQVLEKAEAEQLAGAQVGEAKNEEPVAEEHVVAEVEGSKMEGSQTDVEETDRRQAEP